MVRNDLSASRQQEEDGRLQLKLKSTENGLQEDYETDDVNGHSLYKVPVDQRRANPEAYSPYLFSFGPYHYSNHAREVLGDGDHFMKKAAEALLEDGGLEELIEKLQLHDSAIRSQYAQLSAFLQPDVTNAGILASLLALAGVTMVAATLPWQMTPLIYPVARLVLSDAILLENQIPIIVLKYALDSLKDADPLPRSNLLEVVDWYCKRASPFPNLFSRSSPLLDSDMKKSLLSFIYDHVTAGQSPSSSHGGSSNTQPPDLSSTLSIDDSPSLPTASHLARCGVSFRPYNTNVRGVDFNTSSAVMSMPRIIVNDTTVRVLHNLLAYEATCRLSRRQYSFISYIHFMDCLIDTADDVRVLVEAGVVCNKLGSHDELASMWNKLCNSVSCGITKQHRRVMAQAEMLAKKRWRRWRAGFKEVYWEKQPWLLFSIIAAIILLVLSLLQTIYTIMG